MASLYWRSTSPGMRPRAGTASPFSVAHARITLGSRVALVDRDRVVRLGWRRRFDGPSAATGRAAFQYLSRARESEARFFFESSSSRQSPFQPSRSVSGALGSVEVVDQHFHCCLRHCLPFDDDGRRYRKRLPLWLRRRRP